MADASLARIERKALGNKSIFTLIKLGISEWSDDDAATWSAALACYAILALAPLAVLALKIFTIFTSTPTAQDKLQTIASQWMGASAGDAIHEILTRASQPGQGKWAAAISLGVAIVSAGGVMSELQQAMNRIWKVKAKAGNAALAFIKARAVSVMVIAIAAIVLLASVIVTSWIEKITGSIGLSWKYITWGIDAVASGVVATLLFALLYRTLPDVSIGWKPTWAGAAISALLFLVGKYGLALYFKFGAPTSAFGAVGSLAAILIWVYYSCLIIFFGAELTQVFVKLHGYPVKLAAHAQWLSECDETETATPSKFDPGQKPMRPDQARATRPKLNAPKRPAPARIPAVTARPMPTAKSQPRVGPAVIAGTAAAATAAVAGYVALRMRQSTKPLDTRYADRVGAEIDRLSERVVALAAR